jgi:TonB family protein
MGPYRPDWLEKPTGDDMAEFYPRHAARNNISGKAKISCTVTASGLLEQCRVIEESPVGEHFGEAALRLSSKFRMIPPDSPDAAPGTVTIPIVFQVPEPHVFIRSDTNGARDLMIGGGVIASVAAILLIALIVLLARYNGRAALRAGRQASGKL